MRPSLFPIDINAAAGRQLLQLVAERHGPTLAATASLPARLFGIVSPLAPGLMFAGAEAALNCFNSDSSSMIGSSGSGLSLEDAVASCLGETVERLSQAERQGDVVDRAPVSIVSGSLSADCQQLLDQVASDNRAPPESTVDWVAGWDVVNGRERLVPADWCLRRAVDGPLRMRGTPLSIGVAAGPTLEAASTSALLELIERDAVAQWWVGGRRGRPVGLESLAKSGVSELVAHVRQGERARTSWLLDITTDLPAPTVVAISVASDGKSFACGMAARVSLGDAIRSAVFEMCQMELALLVVELKRQQRGDDALNPVDRQHLARAMTIDAFRCDLLHPIGVARSLDEPMEGEGLAALRQIVADAELDVSIVDLTRPDYAIPVCAALAPTLQRFPSAIQTPRLRRTIDEAGGGDRWTGGIALA